jgi:hypothetical protein
MLQTNDDLQSIQASLALTAKHLAEAAGPMAHTAVPVLGSPPASAPLKSVPMAKILADPAAPIAAAVPLIARAVPMLGIPAVPLAGVPAVPTAGIPAAPLAGVPTVGVPPAGMPPAKR